MTVPPELQQLKQIRSERAKIDKVLGVLLGPIVGPFLAPFMAPAVAREHSVVGIFFATLAWSGGCALATYLMLVKPFGEQGGHQLVVTVGLCFAVSMAVASQIGIGTIGYDVLSGAQASTGSTPVGLLAGIVWAAVLTFGPLGMLLGLASGAWAGYSAARLLGEVD